MGTLQGGESALRFDDGLFFSSLQDDYCLPVRVKNFGPHLSLLIFQVPSHDPEYERLNICHEIFRCSVGLVPDEVDAFLTTEDTNKLILDVGCGTGAWAADMATTYRDAEVYGVDLVNCPLADPPDNATFTVRDVLYGFEDEDDTYDVVHVRDIAMGIRDYPALLTECIRVLKPGGYLVLLELEWMADFLDPDKSAADACPELYNYMQTVHRAVNERGLDPLLGYNFEFYTDMIAHLVSDRTTDRYFVPIAPGHPDPTLNHLGELSVRTWELFAQSSRLLMRDHGECDAEALSEASLKEFTGEEGLYWFFDVCVARKA